ncbi:SPOR domain-containing protein [Shimia marina]|uniref:Cell division protein FtsN n=1 Tax=Shimia marina TaxID=321267 RepID=A0A0P1EPD5_9RHOB|nr:SPOR domain-containing protein [Shimia marina]CUH52165.1 cell division protein FtsN [Shimia marina]SFE72642.1 Cell division protein DedD (protein involved in septation) [Shimia marina]
MTFFSGVMGIHSHRKLLAVTLAASAALSACSDVSNPFASNGSGPVEQEVGTAGQTTKLVERDVEAPEVFSTSESGLWDGRPSLGGVWAAHPDVNDPERVIIRNQSNGKFVIGALFRRERDIPGPRIQVSSDAAAALGMIAGQPVALNVTALRREAVAEETPEAPDATAEDVSPSAVEEAPLEPIAAASAAIAAAEASATTAAKSEVAPKPMSSSLTKPYVQIGIFSVEANAKRAASQMSGAGLTPLIRKTTSGDKQFWRVLVGPASSKSELKSMTDKVHGIGFTDAYAVTN